MAANTDHTPFMETHFNGGSSYIDLLPSIMDARSLVVEYRPRTLINAAPEVVRADLPAAEEPEPAATGWGLVDALQWYTVSDRVITEAAIRAAFAKFSYAEVRDLRAFLRERDDELTLSVPHYLEVYDRKTRLQFVALGRHWFETLINSPTIASYLQNECQDLDLEAILFA